MARKPPPPRQRLIEFAPERDETAVLDADVSTKPEGGSYAVHDDSPGDDSAPAGAMRPAPPGAADDGTVIGPPGLARGQSVPPEGLPQFSPCQDAGAPGLKADSLAGRPAPLVGPLTNGEGDPAMDGNPLDLPLPLAAGEKT